MISSANLVGRDLLPPRQVFATVFVVPIKHTIQLRAWVWWIISDICFVTSVLDVADTQELSK